MKKSSSLLYFIVLTVLFTLPFYTGVYVLNVMGIILIYMALALSWDMLLRSGQISFGMAGFFGVGGYGAALFFLNTGVHPLVSIVLGGLVAGGPRLAYRLRGPAAPGHVLRHRDPGPGRDFPGDRQEPARPHRGSGGTVLPSGDLCREFYLHLLAGSDRRPR